MPLHNSSGSPGELCTESPGCAQALQGHCNQNIFYFEYCPPVPRPFLKLTRKKTFLTEPQAVPQPRAAVVRGGTASRLGPVPQGNKPALSSSPVASHRHLLYLGAAPGVRGRLPHPALQLPVVSRGALGPCLQAAPVCALGRDGGEGSGRAGKLIW